MEIWQNKNYSKIIGYAVGQYYEKTKEELSSILKLDYLCDRKWDESNETEYDGIEIVRRKDLKKLGKVLLIVFVGNSFGYESIKRDLKDLGVDYIHVDDVVGRIDSINGKMLKEKFPNGVYEDIRNNKVFFDNSLPDKLVVSFGGRGSVLRIAPDVLIENLYIRFGNNGFCSIGKNTEIIEAKFYVVDAKIEIGEDCLFSTEVILRTHDAHHIFDRNTHQRINYPKDILIGDNVWIAFRVTLLGGTNIGTGSVVGTNAITSSKFGNHQIIVGSPARVVRENICWSRENTEYFNRSCLEECISQEALRYMN